ncbi:MAG TPA: regulatory iron-sulfur-containing complex subunit RicT [Cyclobacteriaceae bacterium]|nr:regulatory iron-sulfur-containing complex subunit RicT [Cyclobacteriaceae bacterium]HMV88630.1 regulatory iron-sulfur-containing complex subunit RicT [Cyclobacteriaceae bacterium]HMX49517.1 regulatory iron-sulfur-containing complex subunit RicT [Cyclobacteriaceae bacterium]HMY93411.1 regulatory iron-sulfur-containing complex subunit RicT [Cyclobacteriaceae bacterium]HNA13925.1 regulatory iron-sulfur-containing complex subunit RicT [Cyclobacteriaceae bacterium]
MGCACGTSKSGKVAGCKNNGACQTGGCNKMNVFDWLSNMEMPSSSSFEVVEVRFKNGRKEFFRNAENFNLTTGDAVVVEVPNGHHLGHVSLQGELVRLQMQKKKIANDSEIKKIYRLAHQKDLEKYEEVKKREMPTLYRTREILREIKLPMKLSDIEYQADNTKATFFYSADDRVDFRELIKRLATEFRIRVEMRQISLRQEAGRLGGIGVCGRELCCSTWLSDFKNVATSAARYQNLSLNPSKLSGQCGRLKCCLNYELETYMEALQDIPKIENPLLTEAGEAKLQKTDIFRKIMWFGFNEENTWYPLNVDRVNHILEMNRAGKKPATLQDDVLAEKIPVQKLNSDLERMDQKFRDKSKKKKKKKKGNRDNQGQQGQAQNQNPNRTQGQNPNTNRPQGQGQNQNRGQGQGQNQNRNQNQQNPNRNQNQQNPNRNKQGNQNQQRNQNPNKNRNQNNPNNPNRNQNPEGGQPRTDS